MTRLLSLRRAEGDVAVSYSRRLLQKMVFTFCLLMSQPLAAHQLKTVVLNLDMPSAERVQVSFKSPLGSDGRPASVVPVITPACNTLGDSRVQRGAGVLIRYWQWSCPGGLNGREIRLQGLNVTAPDGIVQITTSEGEQIVHVLDRHQSAVTFDPGNDAATLSTTRVGSYLTIGMEHILLGPDHLLFVFCLLLILMLGGACVRQLLVTNTAFTVAHSLTLGLSVLWGWRLPSTPVEAVIALSILLLAVEVAYHHRGGQRTSFTFRYPGVVAFVFGLLHGFGFAGALADIGLPEGMQGWALLLFNLGVEAGQVLFVAAVLLLAAGCNRISRQYSAYALSPVVTGAGAVSAYWFIDRLLPVFGV